ncbi:MAG: type II toxin-antitoxin system VapC family toxin [Phycisphaerae bacterium]
MNNFGTIVAIDSQTLIWAIRGEGSEDQKNSANWLFQELQEWKAQVIIPSICLAEYLVPIPVDHHRDVIASLSRFIIAPFDVRCASTAAKLFMEEKPKREMSAHSSRKVLKADCMIVATASTHGAQKFYSNDTRCRKIATRANLLAEDLPKGPKTLFDMQSDDFEQQID